MNLPFLLLFIIVAGAFLSIQMKKLTYAAALTGSVIAVLLYVAAGYTGVVMMAAFFLSGTVVTSWKRDFKEQLGIAEQGKGRRRASQVLANAGAAGIFACTDLAYPGWEELFRVMIAACLASAASDTFSSEIGSVYGRRFFNILTFKSDIRGKDGVISLEGLLAGIAGAAVIALIASFGFSGNLFLIVTVSGLAGNISDSLIGAGFERRGLLGNDAVNFFSTLMAALVAFLLAG